MVTSAQDMQSQLIAKSAQDAEFRRQLLADPKGVISNEFGIEIPDNLNIQVHDSDLQNLHLALPPLNELSEEQLEAVSAGLCCCGF